MLNYIRAVVPNDVKGEILEGLLKELCEALQIKLLLCFIGSRFSKIYWKNFAAKIYFLVKLHSVFSSNIKMTIHHRCFLNYILFLENSKIYVEA